MKLAYGDPSPHRPNRMMRPDEALAGQGADTDLAEAVEEGPPLISGPVDVRHDHDRTLRVVVALRDTSAEDCRLFGDPACSWSTPQAKSCRPLACTPSASIRLDSKLVGPAGSDPISALAHEACLGCVFPTPWPVTRTVPVRLEGSTRRWGEGTVVAGH
jgi:hypothetical protein